MMRRLARGSRLGKYRLERRLGVGGSATVWQARDTIEGRRVAVKIVHPAVVQELGREANTIGSKANDAPLAHQVVELKTEIERIREQVQNVE